MILTENPTPHFLIGVMKPKVIFLDYLRIARLPGVFSEISLFALRQTDALIGILINDNGARLAFCAAKMAGNDTVYAT